MKMDGKGVFVLICIMIFLWIALTFVEHWIPNVFLASIVGLAVVWGTTLAVARLLPPSE